MRGAKISIKKFEEIRDLLKREKDQRVNGSLKPLKRLA